MSINLKFWKWSALSVYVLMTMLGASRLSAQATGTIVGTVTDMSGAAIADATVQVKNVGTGVTQNATTDAQGRFRAPDLVIGTYEVQASNTGFQTVVHQGITLTVGASRWSISHFRLDKHADRDRGRRGFAGGDAIDCGRRAGGRQADRRSAAERPQLHAAADAGSGRDANSSGRSWRGQHVLW